MHFKKPLFFLSFISCILLSSSAPAEQWGDFVYDIFSDSTVGIREYTGSGGDVVIPDTIDGMPVVGIMGGYVEVWEPPMYHYKIFWGAFMNCATVTSVTIPNSVTGIWSYAFKGCTLTSVNIPDNVTYIGEEAFSGCGNLTSVTIPGSITSIYGIEQRAFQDCTGLNSVTIMDGVTALGENMFVGCTSLSNVHIPDSVTKIGENAFGGCSGLTSIAIPGSVTSIGDYPFYSCTGLIEINVDPANLNYSSQDGILYNKSMTNLIHYPAGKTGAFTIPGSVTLIPHYAFDRCAGLTGITIPDSIWSLQDYAFRGCTGLTSVTIPGSVLFIGGGAFSDCTGLTSVTITNGVSIIGEWAFLDCTALTTVSIPASITYIHQRSFARCTSLTDIQVDTNNTAYSSQDGVLYNKSKTTIVLCAAGKSGAFTIPDTVTTIGDFAFYWCTGLTSVSFPASVTSIGSYAFEYCTGLTAAYFYGNAPSASFSVFAFCASGVTMYYTACSTGFTNPWYGNPAELFSTPECPLTTTTSVEPTTTTTIPAEPCTVEIFPRRLSKMINTMVDLQAFIIRGYENASFSKATTIDWGTSSVETLIKSALNKRLIIALVLVNGSNQTVGDTYEVTVGDCTGALPVGLF
jgi:hypothetical protein